MKKNIETLLAPQMFLINIYFSDIFPHENKTTYHRKAIYFPEQSDDKNGTEEKELIMVYRCILITV